MTQPDPQITPRTYAPLPSADSGVTILPAPFRPQRKAFFLSHLIRATQSSPLAGLSVVRGNIWHRLLSLFAEQLERASYTAAAQALWAIREGAYRAWTNERFPMRDPATYARGLVRLSLSAPAGDAAVIAAGSLVGSRDGRAASVERDTVFPAGELSVLVPVVSTLPGTAGHFAAGELVVWMGGYASYRASNPAPVAGAGDAESEASIYRRFQDHVESSATGNRLAVYSAAMGARVRNGAGEVTQKVVDAALIYPWATPALNGENGTGYVVIDDGSGAASPELIAAAQALVGTDEVSGAQSAMERHEVVACNTLVVPLDLRIFCVRNANRAAVEAAVDRAWQDYMAARLIEDGRGRGRVSLKVLNELLDKAHADILQCVILNHDGDVQPPLASRAVAGVVTKDVRRGEVIRL